MRLKVSSAKWRPFYLGLNVLKGATKYIAKMSVSYKKSFQFILS